MADKGNPDNANENTNQDGSGQRMLYRFLFDPPGERLSELTDLPLMQITPLTWMATYDEAFEEFVEYVEYAIALRKYKRDLANGVKRAKPPKMPVPRVTSEKWREWYYKHRRSLAGSGVKTAAVLAERQIEVQAEQPSADQLREPSRD